MQHYLVVLPIQVHIHLGLRRCSNLERDIKLKMFDYILNEQFCGLFLLILTRGHLAKLAVEVVFIGNNAA